MSSDLHSNRYAAHLGLKQIGTHGQARIRKARVALIGLGGLGCTVAQSLVSSGVGQLDLCDFDTVSASNLARQILYRQEDIGQLKSAVAQKRLLALNPDTQTIVYPQRADQAFIAQNFADHDLIIDASDNYGTRLAVNMACRQLDLPWIMGACIRMEGQIKFFDHHCPESGCYQCLYRDVSRTLEDCPGAGIFAPIAMLTGNVMALLALNYLAGLAVSPDLHLISGQPFGFEKLKTKAQTDCRVCGAGN